MRAWARRAIPRWPASSATPTAGRRATRFFFPGEQYEPALPRRARRRSRAAGFGEVELHLHHDGDTAETLRRTHRRVPRHASRSTATSRATATGGCATRSSTATGASPTRAATAAGAASTTSCRCCSRPAATPTSRSRRRPTSASPTSSTRSTGRRRSRAAARATSTASARASARCCDDRILMIEGPLALARGRARCPSRASRTRRSPRDDPPTPARVDTWVDAGHPRRGPARVGVRQGPHPRRAREAGGLAARRGRPRAARRR